MPALDELLADFDREMTTTRQLLVRLPADRLDWKPHPKSTSLRGLGRHLAHMLTWGPVALTHGEFDIADRVPMMATPAATDILAVFDANVASLRTILAAMTPEALAAEWTLTSNGRVVLTMSRSRVIEMMILRHLIHHRGQLSVYLRLNDIPVPSIYGPSADESM